MKYDPQCHSDYTQMENVPPESFEEFSVEMYVAFTWTIYSIVENCGMISAGWFISEIPA